MERHKERDRDSCFRLVLNAAATYQNNCVNLCSRYRTTKLIKNGLSFLITAKLITHTTFLCTNYLPLVTCYECHKVTVTDLAVSQTLAKDNSICQENGLCRHCYNRR